LIEQVLSDTVPRKLIVPSAAWEFVDARANRPPVTTAIAEINDLMFLLQ
jgi:hypothetical protein